MNRQPENNRLHLVSLGCARNLVDSEIMMGRLASQGWILTEDPAEADVIAVNTCSFIEPAVNESIDTILALAKFKRSGTCRRLIVAGCLPERYREEIADALPEVDVFIGTGAFDRIADAASGIGNRGACLLPDPNLGRLPEIGAGRLRTTPHIAYLKIAEGCSRHCTYCIIPTLRGRQKSRSIEEIAAEARSLLADGARELILIAQDTTAYGTDLLPPSNLVLLLEQLAGVVEKNPGPDRSAWIRFLYGHPESIQPGIFSTVAKYPDLCSYFDIPIQHASDSVLKKMGRDYHREGLYRLFDRIRAAVPEAALRTTAIVGFPGETDADFDTLVEFVDTVRFDHLGVFVYSDSEDLPSHLLAGHVPESVARERHDRLMSLQAEISLKNNEKHIGRTYPVLVEEAPEENLYLGRAAFQAPEVDGIVYVRAPRLEPGTFVEVKITDALAYDLMGETP